jgi:hypothetical protein
MNKKSRKRAFLVFITLCLLYGLVTFRLPERMSMTRISESEEHTPPSQGMMLPVQTSDTTDRNAPPHRALSPTAVPSAPAEADETRKGPDTGDVPAPAKELLSADAGRTGIEPSLLITIPIVCHAMKEGWVEKESLIFGKKDAYNNVVWKKPIDILKDHDEDGIRNILNTIGQKRVMEFIKKEGIDPGSRLRPEEVILGKGYLVDTDRLLAMYDRYVGAACDELFPYTSGWLRIAKGNGGFEIVRGWETPKDAGEAEWMMPNLASLPMRLAVAKLSAHTSHIRVRGSGRVTGQSPRAFERLRGEEECVIQGRAAGE